MWWSFETRIKRFGEFEMNQRDEELLDKQLHGLTMTPRHDGTMILAVLGIFFAGIALGGFLYAFTDEPPVRIAANDAAPVISTMHAPITRQQ